MLATSQTCIECVLIHDNDSNWAPHSNIEGHCITDVKLISTLSRGFHLSFTRKCKGVEKGNQIVVPRSEQMLTLYVSAKLLPEDCVGFWG